MGVGGAKIPQNFLEHDPSACLRAQERRSRSACLVPPLGAVRKLMRTPWINVSALRYKDFPTGDRALLAHNEWACKTQASRWGRTCPLHADCSSRGTLDQFFP